MQKEMTETLVSFKIAELAKKKGFRRKVLKHDYFIPTYNKKGELIYKYKGLRNPNIILIANQSLLQKWLREVHNCYVEVTYHSPLDKSNITKDNLRYYLEVNYYGKNFNIPLTDDEDYSEYNYLTYEEALEEGLYQALNLLPDKI